MGRKSHQLIDVSPREKMRADFGRDDDAVNTEEKIWDLTHNINVKGVWYGCKHAIIAMRKVCPRPSAE